jgi:hypothetical protein
MKSHTQRALCFVALVAFSTFTFALDYGCAANQLLRGGMMA